MTTEEQLEELQHIGNYEGAELEEYWNLLRDMWSYRDCFTIDFVEQFMLEVELQHEHALELVKNDIIEMDD